MNIYAVSLFVSKKDNINENNQFEYGGELKFIFTEKYDKIINMVINWCKNLRYEYKYITFGYEKIENCNISDKLLYVLKNDLDFDIKQKMKYIFDDYKYADEYKKEILIKPFTNRMLIDLDNKEKIKELNNILKNYKYIINYDIYETKNGYHIRIYPKVFIINHLSEFIKEIINLDYIDQTKFVLHMFNNIGIDLLFTKRWKLINNEFDEGEEVIKCLI